MKWRHTKQSESVIVTTGPDSTQQDAPGTSPTDNTSKRDSEHDEEDENEDEEEEEEIQVDV